MDLFNTENCDSLLIEMHIMYADPEIYFLSTTLYDSAQRLYVIPVCVKQNSFFSNRLMKYCNFYNHTKNLTFIREKIT